jgi:hypothetical protein
MERIIVSGSRLSYLDEFHAAREARALLSPARPAA